MTPKKPRPTRTPEQRKRRNLVVSRKVEPCRYPTRSGAPCRSFAIAADAGCFTHTQDPSIMSRRRERNVRGGQGAALVVRGAKLLLSGPFGPLTELVVRSMGEVYEGDLDPNRLNALAQAMRAIVQAKDHDMGARIVARLERQIDAMDRGDEERPAEVWSHQDGRVEVLGADGVYVDLEGDTRLLDVAPEDPS